MVGKVPVISIDRASIIVRFVRGRSYAALGKKMRTTWEWKTDQIAKIAI